MTKYFAENCEYLKPVDPAYFFVERVEHLYVLFEDIFGGKVYGIPLEDGIKQDRKIHF